MRKIAQTHKNLKSITPRHWETSYIIILITNHFHTMKIGTYLFGTRGHTHRNLVLYFIIHIYLFDPCLLHVSEEEETCMN